MSPRVRPLLWVWPASVLRAHLANRCETCHPSECWICTQAASLAEGAKA